MPPQLRRARPEVRGWQPAEEFHALLAGPRSTVSVPRMDLDARAWFRGGCWSRGWSVSLPGLRARQDATRLRGRAVWGAVPSTSAADVLSGSRRQQCNGCLMLSGGGVARIAPAAPLRAGAPDARPRTRGTMPVLTSASCRRRCEGAPDGPCATAPSPRRPCCSAGAPVLWDSRQVTQRGGGQRWGRRQTSTPRGRLEHLSRQMVAPLPATFAVPWVPAALRRAAGRARPWGDAPAVATAAADPIDD